MPRLIRRTSSIIVGVALVVASAAVAVAAAPERSYAPAPDVIELPGTCAFPVVLNVLVNREYAVTFFDAAGTPTRMQITGRLVVRVTNADTGASIVVNASGPATFDLVSGDVVARGAFLQWADDIDGLNLYIGRHDFSGVGTGRVVSVCDALSG